MTCNYIKTREAKKSKV